MTAKEAEERSQAKRTLEAIESLRLSKHWAGYYLRRLGEKKAALERNILDNPKLSPEQMHDERVKRDYLRDEIAGMTEQDYASARKVLGIKAEDGGQGRGQRTEGGADSYLLSGFISRGRRARQGARVALGAAGSRGFAPHFAASLCRKRLW